MASPFGFRLALGCLAVLSVCVYAWGQKPFRPLVPLPDAVPVDATVPAAPLKPEVATPKDSIDGCIVLRDGTVRTGKIVELAAGYQIVTRKGTFVFNYDQVRAVAESPSQAYQQIRESFERPTASMHLDLGLWCAKNGLMEEARVEAESALLLEPTRQQAADLLSQAEAALGPEATAIEAPENHTPVPVTMIAAQAQGEFIRQIQPLMVNKCGNGNCHGSGSTSDFKLAAVRTGASSQTIRSSQNLTAILKYTDAVAPAQSPLLVKARSADGHHDGLFIGNRGTDQYKTLLTWVEKISREEGRAARPRPRPVGDWREGPRITVRPRAEKLEVEAEPESVASDPPEIQTVAAETPSEKPVTTRAPLRSKTVQRLLQNQKPDAFDPEEFNRLVHGDRSAAAPVPLPE